jgi:hypothetical protein
MQSLMTSAGSFLKNGLSFRASVLPPMIKTGTWAPFSIQG